MHFRYFFPVVAMFCLFEGFQCSPLTARNWNKKVNDVSIQLLFFCCWLPVLNWKLAGYQKSVFLGKKKANFRRHLLQIVAMKCTQQIEITYLYTEVYQLNIFTLLKLRGLPISKPYCSVENHQQVTCLTGLTLAPVSGSEGEGLSLPVSERFGVGASSVLEGNCSRPQPSFYHLVANTKLSY